MRNTLHLVSARDCLDWRGLSGLREVVERLPLRAFRTEQGEVLYDLPGAPRPPEGVPAPPRFLPAYDNLLLSHADRTRVNPCGRPVPLPPGNGTTIGTFLIDGTWHGTWQIRDPALQFTPFTKLRRVRVRDCAPATVLGVRPQGSPGVDEREQSAGPPNRAAASGPPGPAERCG